MSMLFMSIMLIMAKRRATHKSNVQENQRTESNKDYISDMENNWAQFLKEIVSKLKKNISSDKI